MYISLKPLNHTHFEDIFLAHQRCSGKHVDLSQVWFKQTKVEEEKIRRINRRNWVWWWEAGFHGEIFPVSWGAWSDYDWITFHRQNWGSLKTLLSRSLFSSMQALKCVWLYTWNESRVVTVRLPVRPNRLVELERDMDLLVEIQFLPMTDEYKQ